MSQVTLESVEIIEIQTFVIGLPVGPAALMSQPLATPRIRIEHFHTATRHLRRTEMLIHDFPPGAPLRRGGVLGRIFQDLCSARVKVATQKVGGYKRSV